MASIEPQSVEELLQNLVRLNTVNTAVSGNVLAEEPVASYLQSLAQAWNIPCKRLPVKGRADNLLLTYQVNASSPWLLFESHMDTVSVEGMTIDPFAGDIRGGKLFGRGACDTKGTGAAMLWALRLYMQQSGEKSHNVAILFAIDEEFGMLGVQSFLAENYNNLGFTPRGAIVGEPTRLIPITAHNGTVRMKITTTGVSAHSSNPSRGRSAIRAMTRVIDQIEDHYIPQLNASHPMTGKAQCSINIIRGGSQINIIPEHCEIHLDRRVVPGEDPQQVIPAMRKLLDELAQDNATLQTQIEQIFFCPPLDDRGNGPLKSFVQGALRELSLPDQAKGEPYSTDGGFLSAGGVPTVVLGPGDIAQAHTKDEFIEIDQLQRGAQVYLKLMMMR